jgi:5-formyltetrahydrofolate cyclo-ligase
MSDAEREQARAAIRSAVLACCTEPLALPVGSRIACYEPLRTEPGSIDLLAELHRRGYEVIVPITLPDRDLDWAVWTLTKHARPPLGVDAVASAALVIVPAFAVDRSGHRLGRGGGSYDRALARVPAGVPVAALVYTSEILATVPVDSWDRPVTAAVTPDGWQQVGRAGPVRPSAHEGQTG